ncbi:hypothetical protein LJR164_004505 [Phenylobacterium sp. LjRoot164]|uniref:hypothetical protein n=1 Tax=unclassified Phenylobacterium TaxID=2640670 RepID=UPI003ECEFD47
MLLATTEQQIHTLGLSAGRERWLRPAVGFLHPRDVLKDPDLTLADKRAVLASWLSDASAVQDQPHLRWLLGTPEPVAAADIREALARLDHTDWTERQ